MKTALTLTLGLTMWLATISLMVGTVSTFGILGTVCVVLALGALCS